MLTPIINHANISMSNELFSIVCIYYLGTYSGVLRARGLFIYSGGTLVKISKFYQKKNFLIPWAFKSIGKQSCSLICQIQQMLQLDIHFIDVRHIIVTMDNENIAVYRPYKRLCSQTSGELYPLGPHRNVRSFTLYN